MNPLFVLHLTWKKVICKLGHEVTSCKTRGLITVVANSVMPTGPTLFPNPGTGGSHMSFGDLKTLQDIARTKYRWSRASQNIDEVVKNATGFCREMGLLSDISSLELEKPVCVGFVSSRFN